MRVNFMLVSSFSSFKEKILLLCIYEYGANVYLLPLVAISDDHVIRSNFII